MSPRILYYDIETAPNLAWVWQYYEQNVLDIKQERYMLCATWRWEHQKRAKHVSVLDDPDGFNVLKPDDRVVAEKMHDVLSRADIIVAHNGDRFDMPWLNTRWLIHGLGPIPPVQSVDTLKIARRHFNFNANRLDYLGKYLGVGGKDKSSLATWMGAVDGDKKMWREMIRYAKRDVDLLREVYLALRPWMSNHPNVANLEGGFCCTKCGASEYIRRGYRYAKTLRYQKYQCLNCGGYFEDKRCDPHWSAEVK